ncbi:MAG: PAS domain-containing sensor histidine kinase [Crocinitomicaceae bacterium]|nr:PAS domain-containing sensor histidine kinase [Crocinitomicaceae bacterium]
MNDQRLIAVSNLLVQYSLGNFNNHDIELSEELDEIDSIISGVNMLGEELEATTVSRDFFANIYNTVSNILIVTNAEGKIVDVNAITLELFGYTEFELMSMRISELVCSENIETIKRISAGVTEDFSAEVDFLTRDNRQLPTASQWSVLKNKDGEKNGLLVVAEDITEKKNKEREILRNITETQENERARVADDLHDSLGQELSSIRLMLSGISGQVKEDSVVSSRLDICLELLDSSLENIRAICFDLIPSALSQGELIVALEQIIRKLNKEGGINYIFTSYINDLSLDKDKQVAIYRVFQEFVHNSAKHSKCNSIKLEVFEENEELVFSMADDGCGFNMEIGGEFSGRGLSTMVSRIHALNGRMDFISEVGKGTQAIIRFKMK